MALAGERPLPRHRHNSALTGALRSARTCYDHLAGRLGVQIHDHLLHEGCLLPGHDGNGHDHDYEVSPSGHLLLAKLGIDTAAVAKQRRGFARPCLDRSEEHTSELQSLMRTSYAVFCLKKKTYTPRTPHS